MKRAIELIPGESGARALSDHSLVGKSYSFGSGLAPLTRRRSESSLRARPGFLERALLIAVLTAVGSVSGRAAVIFSDNFDDGDVSDWTLSTNYPGATAITVRSDSFVSPGFALWTRFVAPPIAFDVFVGATHSFVTTTTSDYTLSLWARSSPCDGCLMLYEILVDGASLAQTHAPDGFEFRSFVLSGLAIGAHDLTLRVFTANANNGLFNASFDDVLITGDIADTGVPEPATLTAAACALAVLALRRKLR